MKTDAGAATRKRPVNLTLNEDLVKEARALTGNLSEVVESLLTEFVDRERRERLEKSQAVAAAVRSWNAFNARAGSFSDEYSTL